MASGVCLNTPNNYMIKLYKPIYPAKDYKYSPNYKNQYNKVDNGFSVVGQKFGANMLNIYKEMGMQGHNGIDIPCKDSTPVFSSHAGVVVKLCLKESYGLGITLQDAEGNLTIYWHLKKILVRVGDKVKEQDLIGLADNTGYSTGSHLHYGLYPKGEPKTNGYDGAVDPMPFIIENPKFYFEKNLWIGQRNEDVKKLQITLADEGFLGYVGSAGFTGYFGLETLGAVKAFQKKYGIINTGFVGILTRTQLNSL
jgi:hypothetical protein